MIPNWSGIWIVTVFSFDQSVQSRKDLEFKFWETVKQIE